MLLQPLLRSLFAALASLLLLTGCDSDDGGGAASGGDVPEADRYGGTAVIGTYGDLQSMNALVSSDNNSNEIQRNVLYMPLIKYNESIEPIPWLAESWDTAYVAGDSIDLTFHLRRDIRWHDGQPTTAADVEFTFARAVNPETAFPNISGFDLYRKSAEVIDPYTIRFRLQPHAEYMDMWYQTAIMPEHILGDVPPGGLLTHPFGTQTPMGNGPFRFVRRNAGQEWVFEANPDFPAELGGRPYLDRIVWRYIPEQTTLLTELLTGGIDVYTGVNPNQAQQVEQAANVRLLQSPSRQWNYLAWNLRKPMFADARVRRALTMAIDRQAIVDALIYGYGQVGRSTVTPAHWSFDADDPQTMLPYDTVQARTLLTEAGWIDRDNDGILENARGQEFRFTIKTNQGNDTRKDMAEIIQAQLRQMGIVAQPQLVEWNTLVAQLQTQRDFDAVISGWVDYFRKDDSDILHSKNLDKPYQYVGFSNPRADELLDTLAIMDDREASAALWKEYQQLMVQQSPYTVLYLPERLNAVSGRLNGVEMDIRGELPTVTRWWISPSQRQQTATTPAPAPSASPEAAAAMDTTAAG